ncbi:MAG: AI-2E family transporter [Deltaproteobacteria bacterium]|nr:AI-2E family transporter [Deltaproteobacteria bacterium]
MATAILVIAAIDFARSVLAPLAFALLLSVVLAGVVTRVERLGFRSWRIGRVAAVLLISLAISATFVAAGWTVVSQGRLLAQELPEYQRNLEERVRERVGSALSLPPRRRGLRNRRAKDTTAIRKTRALERGRPVGNHRSPTRTRSSSS